MKEDWGATRRAAAEKVYVLVADLPGPKLTGTEVREVLATFSDCTRCTTRFHRTFRPAIHRFWPITSRTIPHPNANTQLVSA